jgi:hypothetical protein
VLSQRIDDEEKKRQSAKKATAMEDRGHNALDMGRKAEPSR